MNFNLSMGAVKKPQRLLIYGVEGIGKTTFASQMPDPVFIDIEQGTLQLNVARLDEPTNWQTVLDEVAFITSSVPEASTIVIDTADAAERLCQEWVCAKYGKSGIEDFGYGKGYVYARDEYNKLLQALDKAIAAGINVVVVAHSQMRKFERPDETGAYDRFELKLNKHVSALVKEWADAVLFCDYETYVTRDEASGKAKASGGKRVIRTDHNPCWDAKNRWNLPEKLALDKDGIGLVREQLTVRKQQSPAPESMPEPKPATKKAPRKATGAAKSADKADTGKAERDRMKESAKRFEKLDSRFDALKQLMFKDMVNFDDLETIMAAQGKREIDNKLEDWEQPFVVWVINSWPRVLELVAEREHIKREQKLMDSVKEEEIPF